MFEQYKITFYAIGIGVIVLAFFVLYSHGKNLEVSLAKMTDDRNQHKQALDYQNDALLKNKADYEAKMKDANKTSVRIQTEYKTRTQYIYQWEKKDENRTCDDAVSMLNRYPF